MYCYKNNSLFFELFFENRAYFFLIKAKFHPIFRKKMRFFHKMLKKAFFRKIEKRENNYLCRRNPPVRFFKVNQIKKICLF